MTRRSANCRAQRIITDRSAPRLVAPVMAVMMLIASNRRIMGRLALSRSMQTGGWLATSIMLAASIGFFVL